MEGLTKVYGEEGTNPADYVYVFGNDEAEVWDESVPDVREKYPLSGEDQEFVKDLQGMFQAPPRKTFHVNYCVDTWYDLGAFNVDRLLEDGYWKLSRDENGKPYPITYGAKNKYGSII